MKTTKKQTVYAPAIWRIPQKEYWIKFIFYACKLDCPVNSRRPRSDVNIDLDMILTELCNQKRKKKVVGGCCLTMDLLRSEPMHNWSFLSKQLIVRSRISVALAFSNLKMWVNFLNQYYDGLNDTIYKSLNTVWNFHFVSSNFRSADIINEMY